MRGVARDVPAIRDTRNDRPARLGGSGRDRGGPARLPRSVRSWRRSAEAALRLADLRIWMYVPGVAVVVAPPRG